MPSLPAHVALSRLLTLVTFALVIVTLYLAQAMLLPLALAILFSFLLSPLVSRLEHWGLPRIPAVVAVVAVAFAGLATMIVVFSAQLVQVTYELPEYESRFREKVRQVRTATEPFLGRLAASFDEFTDQVFTDDTAAAPLSADKGKSAASTERVVPVRIVDSASSPLAIIRDWLGPILSPLATAGIVTIFVVFILIEREDLRNRTIVLLGEKNLRETTRLLDDASHRVSRYLRMQVLINALFGAAVTVGLLALQMPNAALWGLLAFVARFVPFVGAWMAALLPTALSLVVFDNWGTSIAIAGMYIVLELIANNVLEPWLYGASTGLSSIGIILSAFFWTWLWGGVGLVLATPLTVCLTAWGRYVPQLNFLNILLSDQPALPPGHKVYQRLLAFDFDEASNVVEDYQKTHDPIAVGDEVLLATLQLVEQDRHDNALEPEVHTFMMHSLRELADDLPDVPAASDPPVDGEQAVAPPVYRILCLPAHDEADEIAAQMVCRLWRGLGHVAELVPAAALVNERVEFANSQDFDAICISAVPPSALLHARYLCKKLRPRFPNHKIVAGLWNEAGDLSRQQKKLQQAGADQIVTTLGQAMEQLRLLTAAGNLNRTNREAAPGGPTAEQSAQTALAKSG